MNTTKIILTACACLLLAGAALADQGPPVKIRVLGDPRGVDVGETFKGTLEILMGAGANLSEFRFEGDGYRVLDLNVSDELFADKDERLEIPFEVEVRPGAGDIIFAFEYEGYTVTKNLNFTRAHFERMTRGAETREVPAGPEPVRNPDMLPVKAAEGSAPDNSGNQPDPEDVGGVEKRTINVNGRFTYQRSDGVTIGADGVEVRIYDEDTLWDDHLATTITDAYGYFSVNINTDDAGENNPDIRLEYETVNSVVEVEDATWENNYSWGAGPWNNFSGSTLNTGWRSPSNESEHPALHICTDIVRTWRWLLNHEGYDTPSTDVQWPDGSTGAWYNTFWEEIHVSTGRQWNEATHSHEYMHHWVNRYATSVSPDYCNGMCDNDGCGHCIWCWETDHDAYAEGFPNWVADVLTRSYAGDYGIASLFTRPQENLNTCSQDGTWDNPYTTEGFLGALMRDIEDSGNDNHAHYPGWSDAMSVGTNEIFDVADFDQPTTPAQFLDDFRDRFPNLREDLWETGKNCGYDFDDLAPNAPTNLGSSSHSTSGDSPDPTIRYTWTRAYDDASGVEGYGIFISSSPGMPGATLDIGDVTSYTTATLSPGTYYFNLRTLDRSGKWSTTYASFGPITVRDAEPSDLTSYQATGWDFPLVPRDDNTATGSSAVVSSSLPGNVTGTYWNVRGINQGESGTSVGFQTRLYVDDAYRWWASWGTIGAGGSFYGTNLGPVSAPGGRHALEARFDATELVSETDETNNRYGRQFIWTPYAMTTGSPIARSAPANATAGWDAISGQALWYNCDGLRTGSSGWWNAVWVRSLDNDDNLDCRLHPVSTDPNTGFSTNLGYSARSAGYLDAVLTNANVSPDSYWDVGVLNTNDSSSSYQAKHVVSTGFTFGDSVDINLPAEEFLKLHEFNVGTANVGFVSVTVDVDPADGPLTVLWLPETFETGTLSSYGAAAVTNSYSGRARLDIEIPDSGYNCVVVYRDPKDGSAALDYTLEIQTTPPDFLPLDAAGWHAPIVPRPADDGTLSAVALPDTLHGNTASTYLNFAARNESPNSSIGGLLIRAYIDGVYRAWISWGAVGPFGNRLFNWDQSWNIAGGRHTLDMRCDPLLAEEEIYEDNNNYGEQYVWSPLSVPVNTTVSRNAPPDRTGGWDEINSGEILWYNCDGLRIPSRSGWWQAMAVMPSAGADVDVRLHDMLTGVKNGFGGNLATSSWGLESSDFVLINYNFATSTGMDAGVLNWDGSSGYTAENVTSTFYASNPAGQSPDYDIAAGRILDLYEVYLDPAMLPSGVFSVELQEISGGVDWGISLHQSNIDYQNKSSVVEGGSAFAEDAGQGEFFEVAITEVGYYCVAVWKAGSDDLAKNGAYRLFYGNALTPVGDEVPAATGLAGIYPNPFNPQTTIAFDLAGPTRTSLAIYDLQGSLVRTLVSESLGTGRHEIIWNGRNNNGGQTASGVYMARLVAGSVTQMRKLVLVK